MYPPPSLNQPGSQRISSTVYRRMGRRVKKAKEERVKME
jgi:hypothetical protein